MINICPHSASLLMPIGDPLDGFFYLTLMIDSYSIIDYFYLYHYQRVVAAAVVVAAPRRVQTRKIPGVSLGVPHLNNRETTVRKVSDIFIFIIIREQ